MKSFIANLNTTLARFDAALGYFATIVTVGIHPRLASVRAEREPRVSEVRVSLEHR